MGITRLDQLLSAAKVGPRKTLVVVCANDVHTIDAVYAAAEAGIVDPILLGDEAVILQVCASRGYDPGRFQILHEPQESMALSRGVEIVREGRAQLLMKGLVSTDKYMRAILRGKKGLVQPGSILCHVAVIQVPAYHKLLICTDAAVLTYPDLPKKIAMTKCVIGVAHSLDIENPKVAIVCATEQVIEKLPPTLDAREIVRLAELGQIPGAIIEGPMALDMALERASAETKGAAGQVTGDADCLVFPNIDAGNVFYKACSKLANAEIAAVVMGAKVPCVLSSRGDSARTKLYSIALAALSA
jgi:phosphotransacetylase